jgi:hypothetical protein
MEPMNTATSDRKERPMSNVIQFPKPYIERDPEPGDRVSHHAYGIGTVMKVEERDDGYDGAWGGGLALTIAFDSIKSRRIIWVSYFKEYGGGIPNWDDEDGGDAA